MAKATPCQTSTATTTCIGKRKNQSIGSRPTRSRSALATPSRRASSLVQRNPTIAGGQIQASSTATFLEIAGQKVNTLTADTTYSQSTVDFKAVAQEGRRELAAGGSVILHPDHQEDHINDLALRSEQIEWHTPPGVSAAIRYGGDRIEVKNLEPEKHDDRQQLTVSLWLGRKSQNAGTNKNPHKLERIGS